MSLVLHQCFAILDVTFRIVLFKIEVALHLIKF